jgi:hypothetical protein
MRRQRWPIHSQPLRTHRLHCGQAMAYRRDAFMLDALLRCRQSIARHGRNGVVAPKMLVTKDRVAITRAALPRGSDRSSTLSQAEVTPSLRNG